ncbi:MAG: hypothetical protein ACR2L1_01400 [Pyrinomonadaceae bacterium]
MSEQKLCTAAWLLVGLARSEAGILRFDGGRLTFIGDESGCIFDASLAEISSINFPRHYFGAGCKLQIGVTEYRLSFIEPENSGGVGLYTFGGSEDVSDLSGRKAGKAWKAILNGNS